MTPSFKPGDTWKPVRETASSVELRSSARPAADTSAVDLPRWEYQWEDTLNAITERAVEPPLQERIVSEIRRRAPAASGQVLLHVRGELGVGKSTLVKLLLRDLQQVGADLRHEDALTANAMLTCAILEADDLESPSDFATRVNAAIAEGGSVVVLARPSTLDAAAQWIRRDADASVTIRTFAPGRPIFQECLTRIADRSGLTSAATREALSALASRLPPFLQTPFYFEELAKALIADPSLASDSRASIFDVLRHSLEVVLEERGAFDDLVQCAFGRKMGYEVAPIAGVIDERGFYHDGYRNLVLAIAVLDENESFALLTQQPNAFQSMRIVLGEVERRWRPPPLDPTDPLIADMIAFVDDDSPPPSTRFPIYAQSLVADALRKVGYDGAAATLRARCLRLVEGRTLTLDSSATTSSDKWWDVSDALSLVGDPRLQKASARQYGPESGYFTLLPETEIQIGSDFIPERHDAAKPVLPYRRTAVRVGPMWVANFLVTNEQFAEFWSDPKRERFFSATGAQWVRGEPSLLASIEASFNLAASRCFWKETSEQQAVALGNQPSGSMTVLDVARSRALRRDRVALWDPTQADDRFSARGNPVVGVTWWEAMAFCSWWTDRKLSDGGFPSTYVATLPTDWEWEGLRRLFYEPGEYLDGPSVRVGRYPAHLRTPTDTQQGGRVNNVLRPLHVGLAPVPRGAGPYDMVGNVWEWTRSRVYGTIVASSSASLDPAFGDTAWDDVDADAEQTPQAPHRDTTSDLDDLTYRAVRGGSFFSIDEQAAWHPAYRLCDPPFSSYMDLGFRVVLVQRDTQA